MNAPCSGAPLTAPHVTTGGLCRWKAINKVGRHVGLDFYDLLIEGHYTNIPRPGLNWCNGDVSIVNGIPDSGIPVHLFDFP